MKANIKYLKEEQNNGKKIAIYCAGLYGTICFHILKICGIKIDLFFDSDSGKWGTEVLEGIYCLNPYMIFDKDNYIILICIRSLYYAEVYTIIREMGFINIIILNDILDDIILHNIASYRKLIGLCENMSKTDLFENSRQYKHIYDEKNLKDIHSDRIAVYTGIFNEYDSIFEPQATPENVDYYLISECKPKRMSTFRWIDARTVIPPNIISPIKKNRYIKMHPHILFPEYKYSIYIDGNVSILGDITSFIKSNKVGISAFLHPKRDCIFYEALAVASYKRVAAENICKQMSRYLEDGMPVHYGLMEMGVIAREHHNPICIEIMEDWWSEFNKETERDQLSFMYVLWKKKIALSDISLLGSDIRKNNKIKINKHS